MYWFVVIDSDKSHSRNLSGEHSQKHLKDQNFKFCENSLKYSNVIKVQTTL